MFKTKNTKKRNERTEKKEVRARKNCNTFYFFLITTLVKIFNFHNTATMFLQSSCKLF